MNWIIAYDIAHPRRLQKAHRYLSNIAIPLQNSVFLYSGSLKHFEKHFALLSQKLNPHEDDLRAYPLISTLHRIGKASLPEGIYLSDFPEKCDDQTINIK